MKKIILLLVLTVSFSPTFAQVIVNLVLVGKNGVTNDIKEANSFVAIKKFPDSFQRLDYKLHGPLKRARSYSDSTLKILQGPCYEYANEGWIAQSGYYFNNLKEKDWNFYNDTGKVIQQEKYEKGVLVKTINPDTLKKDSVNEDKLKDGEKEATYKKGNKDWISYLIHNLNADAGNKSINGGQVRVGFTVNTSGQCVEIYLRKSIEFVLDEEAIRVIQDSPLWNPAVQDGKKVNAYRVQPISFAKPE